MSNDKKEHIVELERLKLEIFNNIKTLIEGNQLDKAKALITEIENMGIAADDPEFYLTQGSIAIMEDRLYDAKYYIRAGLESDQNNFNLLFKMAAIYEKEKNKKMAVEYYEKSWKSTSDINAKNKIQDIIFYLKGFAAQELFEYPNREGQTIKVLIGSPVRQKPQILREFLLGLNDIYKQSVQVDYMFIDDNEDEQSSKLLNEFKPLGSEVLIVDGLKTDKYICNSETHMWKDSLVWKVARYKDSIIEYAKNKEYDYLMLVDSDIVMHPLTIHKLILDDKDIISEVFWTKWKLDIPELPQVWIKDEYLMYYKHMEEVLSDIEINSRINGYFDCLKIPGVYEVGGLGACTLISKNAINKGISFSQIQNISFHGEDRHFCIRANAIGLKLYVDTHYPAYHIYRESQLDGIRAYKESYSSMQVYNKKKYIRENMKIKDNKLTLMMLVRNEAERYLRMVLSDAIQYVDEVIILDDASSDNTVEVCEDVLRNVPHTILRNEKSSFKDEVDLRKQLWGCVVDNNPDWILCLDADEVLEDGIRNIIPYLINQPYYDCVQFRLYDMCDEAHGREEKDWYANKYYGPFMVRFQPNFKYIWEKTPLHSKRFPINVETLPSMVTDIRIKHIGWMNSEKLRRKCEIYT